MARTTARAAAAVSRPQPPQPDPSTIYGHQIFKFSPDGKLLMTMGTKGGGRDSLFFWQPNDVLVAPNGNDLRRRGPLVRAPVRSRALLKFDRSGKLIKTIGKFGTGPDDMDQPHALAMDSRGRLFVGDRSNNRILIMDQEGKLLDTWYQFSRPSGIYIDAQDRIYVADSESGSVGNGRPRTWTRGIRIGSAKDGSITAFIPDPAAGAAEHELGRGRGGGQERRDLRCRSRGEGAEAVCEEVRFRVQEERLFHGGGHEDDTHRLRCCWR